MSTRSSGIDYNVYNFTLVRLWPIWARAVQSLSNSRFRLHGRGHLFLEFSRQLRAERIPRSCEQVHKRCAFSALPVTVSSETVDLICIIHLFSDHLSWSSLWWLRRMWNWRTTWKWQGLPTWRTPLPLGQGSHSLLEVR